MKRMTLPQAFNRKPRTPPRAMFADSFSGVLGARWIKAAIVEGKNGGEEDLIQPYEKYEWVSHDFPASRCCRSLSNVTIDRSIGNRAVALCTDGACAVQRKTTIRVSPAARGLTVRSVLFFRYDSFIQRRARFRSAAFRMFLLTENPNCSDPVPCASRRTKQRTASR